MENATLEEKTDDAAPGDNYMLVQVTMFHIATLIGVPGAVGNLLTFVACLKSRLAFSNSSYTIITSLAVVDFASLLYRPFHVTYALLVKNYTSHLFTGFGTVWFAFAMQYHFMLIAANRYCSVVHYTKYSRWFSRSRTAIYLGMCWLTSFGVASTILFDEVKLEFLPKAYTFAYVTTWKGTAKFTQFSLASGCVTVAFLTFTYTRIVLKLRKSPIGQQNPNEANKGRSKVGSKKHELSLAVQFTVITFIYTLNLLLFFINLGLARAGIKSVGITLANNLAISVHFACNPFIYMIFNKTLRAEMSDVVCCGKGRRQDVTTDLRQFVSSKNKGPSGRSRSQSHEVDASAVKIGQAVAGTSKN